jgi:hypothetical protein
MIGGDLGGLEPASTSRFELARAERLGRVIREQVNRIDRVSGRDHEKLVSVLITQEMALRDAERSFRWSESQTPKPTDSRGPAELRMIESVRAERLELLRRARLEDDLASAQAYLGQSAKGLERPVVSVPELYAADRIRSPGERATFVGILPGVDAPRTRNLLTVASRGRDASWQPDRIAALLTISALVALSLAALVFPRVREVDLVILTVVVIVAGYWGGPVFLLGILLLMVAAVWAARGPQANSSLIG